MVAKNIMLKFQIGLHCWITHTEYQNFVHKVFVITKWNITKSLFDKNIQHP